MRILFDVFVFTIIGLTLLFVYLHYGDTVIESLSGQETRYTLFVNNVPVVATVADTPETLTRGLSGVTKLGTNEGKLFIFDHNGKHGIWMKDMLMPLDIIWIDENLKVVHIEKKVTPDTFPTVFAPPTDARFVIEVNAYFTDSLKVTVGDIIFVPPEILPVDIREKLQR